MDAQQGERPRDAIRGHGAFRRFKRLLGESDLRDAWHAFHRSELNAIAAGILKRRRPLSLRMIRRLHDGLGIPLESLIQPVAPRVLSLGIPEPGTVSDIRTDIISSYLI